MKRVDIGGQALIEGVMMKDKDRYCVAVRKPDKEIILDHQEMNSFLNKSKLFRIPFIRGVFAFIESMIIGIKTLTYSAEFFEVDEEEEESKFDKFLKDKFGDKLDDILIGFSIVIALVFGVGLFMLAPMFISKIFQSFITNAILLKTVEGLIRVSIFLIYILLISKMKDIQRVFMYHGAEHKTINCLEHEEELTVENVRKHSRLHKRCGTSFLFIVMFISIFVFVLVDAPNIWMEALSRILLVPIIAGISYEILKWAGRSESKLVSILSYPGISLQKLTTREPDDDMIEVAIAATEGVLEYEAREANSQEAI
ncbi:DUF1385 domain-containing protein [Vallitalea okinawensis]|uniref:DUF1385 domain-containing protein n=1 Tax=Vallitalea okinawensis TaxID=2078660 RepID=UPI000CFB4629|nr:DUF1385 domain-containing protein [Vallitalea okinawensis]